jgi:hypothetical protein
MDAGAEMERQAEAGDADAQLALGLERLGHPDSYAAFLSGAALVERAAAGGHAEATGVIATLEAIGAGRPQSWKRALDGLALAARRGSDHARGQLRILARDPEGTNWEALRVRIDPSELLQAPPPVTLTERPRLRLFRGFATPAECAWLIARMRPRLGPAMVWDAAAGGGRIDPTRSNEAVELRIGAMDVVMALLRARISAATRLPEPIFEVPQVMRYRVGQAFTPHHDFLDPALPGHSADLRLRGQRIGTFLVYLNDGFEGGATEFPHAELNFRGETGDALFFANVTPDGRPDPMTLHAGAPPTAGEKWILSQWIRDRAPGAGGRG